MDYLLTPLIEHWVLGFTLILVRVATCIAVLPLLGRRHVPATVKIGISVSLAMLWFVRFGVAATTLPSTTMPWFGFALVVGREMLFGASLGFAFSLFLVPVQIAGSYIAQEMGLTLATMTDPNTGATSSVPSQMFEALGVMLFFCLNIHHVLFSALHASFIRFPVGSSDMPNSAALMPNAVAEAHHMGLLIAAPMGVCLFITMIGLALMMKASPQFNLFSVGLTLRLLVALVAFVVFLPEMLAIAQRALYRATGLVGWLAGQ